MSTAARHPGVPEHLRGTYLGLASDPIIDHLLGLGVTAVYTGDNVTVDLVAGTASVNGSGVDDTLIGIDVAKASGANDTLISDGSGNTLIAGVASVLVSYATDDLTVDLGAGTAAVNGSSSHDKLVGVSAAAVSGNDDTIKAGAGADTLIAQGSDDSLIGSADGGRTGRYTQLV